MCELEIIPFQRFDLLSFSTEHSFISLQNKDKSKLLDQLLSKRPLLIKGFFIDNTNIYHAPKYLYLSITRYLNINKFDCIAIYFPTLSEFIICHSTSFNYPLYSTFNSYPLICSK